MLPAYNEGAHLHGHLHAVAAALEGRPLELIVVDDGSTDDTLAECQRAAADGLPVVAVHRPVNEGKGAALVHGFRASSGALVAFLDADLEIAPESVRRLEAAMASSGADGAVGVRDATAASLPPARRVMSALYRRLVALLFGLPLRETQAGVKLFHRRVLADCVPRLSARRFAFDVELLVACQRFGYRIAECPVRRDYRRSGDLGRITPGQVLQMLWETGSIYRRASFWTWLRPATALKLWMAGVMLGFFLLGIGLGKIITPLVLRPPISQVFYVLALQFLPRVVRDVLLAVVGGGLVLLSLIYLNRSLVDAFARRDRGDLAGIWRRHGSGPDDRQGESEPDP